jgi:hypothetical protein
MISSKTKITKTFFQKKEITSNQLSDLKHLDPIKFVQVFSQEIRNELVKANKK